MTSSERDPILRVGFKVRKKYHAECCSDEVLAYGEEHFLQMAVCVLQFTKLY